MKVFTIPDDIITTKIEDINFLFYQNNKSSEKNKIFFKQNVISFVLNGEKEIFHTQKPIKIIRDIALINAANCLMTERLSANGENYKALLIFYNPQKLTEFVVKYQKQITNVCKNVPADEICVFPNDAYLTLFQNSIIDLITKGNHLPLNFKSVKLEELFLYLLQNYPEKFCRIVQQKTNDAEVKFKSVIENNRLSGLSVEELAFLTNMSVSTFKRYFKKYYKLSPRQWFIAQKMEYADELLKQNYKPGEIYKEIGYQTVSNFLKAYKKYFGASVSDDKMNF